LHSLLEAEAFEGPSLVLAYLPQATTPQTDQANSDLDAIQIMKNSKIAVDSYVLPYCAFLM